MNKKTQKIYEGKAKILYATDSQDYIIQYFKDEATAFNAGKRGTIDQKGVMNNKISSKIFEFLASKGIPTHYVEVLNDREVLVKRVEIIPIEVVIRNRAAGSLCRNLGLAEGQTFLCPILELCYKDDALKDPLINEYHIRALRLVDEADLKVIKEYTFQINDYLREFFLAIKLELIDFKLEFGKINGKIVLADEISPDTCRLWEVGTGTKFDKDRFRSDLDNVEEAYQEVLSRVSH